MSEGDNNNAHARQNKTSISLNLQGDVLTVNERGDEVHLCVSLAVSRHEGQISVSHHRHVCCRSLQALVKYLE